LFRWGKKVLERERKRWALFIFSPIVVLETRMLGGLLYVEFYEF